MISKLIVLLVRTATPDSSVKHLIMISTFCVFQEAFWISPVVGQDSHRLLLYDLVKDCVESRLGLNFRLNSNFKEKMFFKMSIQFFRSYCCSTRCFGGFVIQISSQHRDI